MIKLNNKNITYVALADSANSIKAPKEIWYADSSNSVKLVYRRKDALIEGEDYEKYHWLKGDGSAYIDTNISVDTSTDDIRFVASKSSFTTDNDEYLFGCCFGNETFVYLNRHKLSELRICYTTTSNVRKTGRICYISSYIDYYQTIVNNKLSIVCNGVQQLIEDAYIGTLSNKCYLFNSTGLKSNTIANNLSVSHFRIGNKLSFVPCKLLKPVPKWLDANGIRRQVGECGMIDLVSGKFYGNVNSVGTFTVENYYERKEWLVGDGMAYIDTLVTSYSGIIKVAFKSTESVQCAIFGRERSISDYTDRIVLLRYRGGNNLDISELYGSSNPSSYKLSTDLDDEEITIDLDNQVMTNKSGDSVQINVDVNVEGPSIILFGKRGTWGTTPNSIAPSDVAIKEFSVSNQINLIPCTLTMDLPASMDANNTPRTKGTSGMWDLVSDRFYGNVASSGTFKAVNLAEGVDYEVHHWLVGDGTAYIDTLIKKLKGTITVDIDRTAVTSNSPILGRESVSMVSYQSRFGVNLLYQYNKYIADIWGNSTASGYHINIDMVDTLYLDLDTKIASTKSGNSTSIDIETNFGGYNMLLFAKNDGSAPSSNRWRGGIGNFKMADVINLTPCRLLRPIPSKYDANGIARQAGECGMYDTVNDVFYGNVALSGSFTVEDDN